MLSERPQRPTPAPLSFPVAATVDDSGHLDADVERTAVWKPRVAIGVCQPIVSFCLAALPARQLRCLAEHPVRYLAQLRAELPVVGLGQGT
jgi:hypothetical protein